MKNCEKNLFTVYCSTQYIVISFAIHENFPWQLFQFYNCKKNYLMKTLMYISKGYLYLYCKQMSFFKIRNCKNAIIATLDVCKHEIQHDHMYMYHQIPSNPWQNTAAQAWLTWSSCRLFVPNKKQILLQLTKYIIIYYFEVHLLGKSYMYMYTKHSKWILNLNLLSK